MCKTLYLNVFLLVSLILLLYIFKDRLREGLDIVSKCKLQDKIEKINKRKPYKVYVCFTTTPSRIDKCEDVVISWMNQTYIPDKIWCNISDKFEKTGERYVIPEWFSKYPILEVNKAKKDYGPITKFLPSFQNTNKDEDILFIISDDDQMYLPHTVEEHINHYEKNEDRCYSVSTLRVKEGKIEDLTKYTVTNIPEGFSSYSIHRSKIDADDLEEYVESLIDDLDFKLSDDLLVGNYLQKLNIYVATINTNRLNNTLWHNSNCTLGYGYLDDALHKGGGYYQANSHFEKYHRCLDKLKKRNKYYFKYI